MANTVRRHLLALLSLAILTWTAAHAKALQENEDEVLISERRDQLEAKEYEEALEKRDEENQEEEEAEEEKEVVEKREPEEEAQENEDTEVLDLETRAVIANFSLFASDGYNIGKNGIEEEGLLLFSGGTVCGTGGFSSNSAGAICRAMGFREASHFRMGLVYGAFQTRRRIGLGNVVCNSTDWSTCSSHPRPTCTHNQDILLTCHGTGFKLVGRRGRGRITTQTEGLLTYQGGTVCNDLFSMNSAHAICRLMGFESAVSWRIGYLYGNVQRRKRIVMDDVQCSGSFWNYCTHRLGSHNCNHEQDVFMTCKPGHAHFHGFQLVDWHGNDAQHGCEGLVLYNGGTVCQDGFTMNAAHAICRALHLGTAVSYRHGLAYGALQVSKNITMDNVSCSSTTWTGCTFTTRHDCNHGDDILLKCHAPTG